MTEESTPLHRSVLEQLTRLNRKRSRKTYYIGDEVHNDFKALCDSIGVPMSQALEIVMAETVLKERQEAEARGVSTEG